MIIRSFIHLFILLVGFLPPPAAVANTPRLMETIGGEAPVELRDLTVESEISGGIVQTTLEMRFFNPNHRNLEGTLRFPLADGQRITEFALDIDGAMRPAVPVEKAKGRKVFEEIQRRNIDPGLLEQTSGNNFQLRVHPIPPHGMRTVRIRIMQALARQGMHWRWRLPLDFGQDRPAYSLKIGVRGTKSAPVLDGMPADILFEQRDGEYQARAAGTLHRPRVLSVSIPAAAEPQAFVQEHQGETYFVTEVPVPGDAVRRPLPHTIGLLWDSSGSGTRRALDAELAVLDAYFKAMGNGEVRLTRLRDRAEAVETYRIVNGDWRVLQAALRTTRYDGATALANWQPQKDVKEYLLVSDGLNSYGKAAFPTLPERCRLYAITSSLSADTARLRTLAERHRGRLVQVDPGQPETAAHALLHDAPALAGMIASGAADVQAETTTAQGGMLRVAGRLTSRNATLHLRIEDSKESRDVVLPLHADLPPHPLAAMLWASFRIGALEGDFELNRAEIERLGRRFGIPTRETSLIVLERLEDYARYRIEPPTQYKAVYDKLVARREAQTFERRKDQLERVVREFNEKIAWWSRTFPKDAPFKREDAGRKPNLPQEPAVALQMLSPQAPVAAAPAPAPAPAPRIAGSAASAAETAPPPPPPRNVEVRGSAIRPSTPSTTITLGKWTPNAPYAARMRAASPDQVYAVYLDEKPSYENSTAFFLDAADLLFEKRRRDLALRVLSNLAEMRLEDRHVLRVLGYRLLQAGAADLAVPMFEEVLRLGEEEPQSFRDLGLAYAATGQRQKAVDTLYEVVLHPWDGRFPGIEVVALTELNAIVANAPVRLDTSRIDPRLLQNMPLDLRVVLTWDADNSDMDLWVTDPNGEKCYYSHPLTYQGGRLSRDFTGGYGPEEFALRHAKPGKYRIEANFFGSRQQIVAGATTLQLRFTTGFGTKQAKTESVTLRLKDRGDTIFVGEFEVKPAAHAGK